MKVPSFSLSQLIVRRMVSYIVKIRYINARVLFIALICCCAGFVMPSGAVAAESAKSDSSETKGDAKEKKEQPSEKKESDEGKKEEKGEEEATEESKEVLAGHSYHGDVFNEGPRQKAYLMGGTGKVNFPVSTTNQVVQQFINQGVGQLYGFWYLEAERSFRHAASLDTNCAMAYWGAAMANPRNMDRAKGFVEQAMQRKDHADEREMKYINALDAFVKAPKDKRDKRNETYTKALEDLIIDYPEDLEAKAFLALHLYGSRKANTSYFAVNALLQDIFDAEPMHSAHHFRIHLWDYRHAEEALRSAALCGQASPSIAHMWHMPGHIFSKLKRYGDAAWQQEASARVDHAHMIRDRVMPDQIHNFAHNNEWLIRNLIFVGRVHDALALARNMTELPRHPKFNNFSKRGSASYGRQRLFQVLRTYELWDDLIEMAHGPYLEPTDVEAEQVKRLRYLGLAYFQTGKIKDGEAQIAALQQIQLKQLKGHLDKGEKEKKTEDRDKARKEFFDKVKKLESAVSALEGHQAIAKKDFKKGYELLAKARSVDEVYLQKVRWLSGDAEKAEEELRKKVKGAKNEVHPLATLVELLWTSGKKDDAREQFEALRKISGEADLDMPVFTRLAPIAAELSYPKDWRVKATLADDIGDRPDLDSLGPFRWHPSPAPDWALKDTNGKVKSSSDFKGKPYVLIFYLGHTCLHCAEQLRAFAPKVKEFADAGLPMVAISTDNEKDLTETLNDFDVFKMPIPLVANSELDVFKAYRVFDDFEDQPLHGTFIIDGDGMVRWQDISYEPFMEPDFVLKEAKRLLNQELGSDGPGGSEKVVRDAGSEDDKKAKTGKADAKDKVVADVN